VKCLEGSPVESITCLGANDSLGVRLREILEVLASSFRDLLGARGLLKLIFEPLSCFVADSRIDRVNRELGSTLHPRLEGAGTKVLGVQTSIAECRVTSGKSNL